MIRVRNVAINLVVDSVTHPPEVILYTALGHATLVQRPPFSFMNITSKVSSNHDSMIPSDAPSECTALGRQVSPGGAPEAEHTHKDVSQSSSFWPLLKAMS